MIKVKENAPDLLRRALSRVPVWAYRKAAWAIEDAEQNLGLIYRRMGRKGLESIQNVGPRLAQVVEALIDFRPK